METYVVVARNAAGAWVELGEGADYWPLIDQLIDVVTTPSPAWPHPLISRRDLLAAVLAQEEALIAAAVG